MIQGYKNYIYIYEISILNIYAKYAKGGIYKEWGLCMHSCII